MKHKKHPIESKIESNEQEIRKIDKRISFFIYVVIFLIFLAVISGIYGLYNLGFQPISWDVKFDSLGSFLAGTSGTMLAFASVIFIYSGLLKQQQQLLRQRSDIDLTLEELQQTREELKGQKEELEKQNAHWEQQRTEDIYFKLIGEFHSIEFTHREYDREWNLRNGCTIIENEFYENKYNDEHVPYNIRTGFYNQQAAPYLRLVKTLHFILVFLHKKVGNEHLLEHVCNALSDIEKRLLFYYFLAYPEKMESFREWYLHSELISRDLAEPHLLQMMDKKRFPPFDMDSYKLTVD